MKARTRGTVQPRLRTTRYALGHDREFGAVSDQQNITGRDGYILVEALAFTIEALSGLPIELRPDNNITDMKRLIEELVTQDVNLSQSQLIARRRLQNVLTYVARPDHY